MDQNRLSVLANPHARRARRVPLGRDDQEDSLRCGSLSQPLKNTHAQTPALHTHSSSTRQRPAVFFWGRHQVRQGEKAKVAPRFVFHFLESGLGLRVVVRILDKTALSTAFPRSRHEIAASLNLFAQRPESALAFEKTAVPGQPGAYLWGLAFVSPLRGPLRWAAEHIFAAEDPK